MEQQLEGMIPQAMVEISNIVWAFDGSKESEEALRRAAQIAAAYGSKIFALYVSAIPEALALELHGFPRDELHELILKAEERHRSRLEALGENLLKEGLEFHGEVLRGKPSETIVKYALERDADLIAMGKRGLGLLDRLLVGSTTLATLRESSIPVLAVKRQDEERPTRLRRILVPLDIGERIQDALYYGYDLARKLGASLAALYVFRLDTYVHEVPPSMMENLLSIAERELKGRIEALRLERGGESEGDDLEEGELEIEHRVVTGISPALAIADYAAENEVDLIVINTHGIGGIKRFILGSVTEKVIQESEVPVLALRPQ